MSNTKITRNHTYCSIHNHSHFSNLKLIDSINREDELIQYAFDLGLSGVALTDHDCLSGHIRAWNYYNGNFTEEQRKNFKLILGNEIYLCRDDLTPENHIKGEKFYHLVLLAKDDIGHEQLRKLSSRAWSRAYMKNIMRTPTFSSDLFEIIEPNKGHLIVSTACLGNFCGVKFAEKEYAQISRHLEMMEALFGKENFYIELQPSWLEEQILYNKYMVNNYWGRYNFVCSTDSHYLKLEDREIHKVFLNSKSSGDREADKFYSSAYMMGYDEIKDYFVSPKGTGMPDDMFDVLCDNTNHIADMVGAYNLKRTSVIPKIKYQQEELNTQFYNRILEQYPNSTTHLREVIEHNDVADVYLLNRLVEPWDTRIDIEQEEKYVIELDYEFEQLHAISLQLNQHMSDYFITMAKMIDIMWDDADSLVGPARGSAASSLINYLLGITQIDPLAQPVELPFWRFLHKDRSGLPD